MYVNHVTQADAGCDFDFLSTAGEDPVGDLPYGLFSGWVGGW